MCLVLGWLAHAVAIVADITGLGHAEPGARFGFAPALSVTLWLVLAVYLLESRFLPLDGSRRPLALLGAAAVLLAWLYPGEFRNAAVSRWAPLHWVLGIASYGLFGTAVLHAVLLNRADRQMRQKRPGAGLGHAGSAAAAARAADLPLRRGRFRHPDGRGGAGLVVRLALALGPQGGVLGAGLGRVCRRCWRGRKAFGWRGPQATRWLYTGAVLLLLAYVGSRFVARGAAAALMKYLVLILVIVVVVLLAKAATRKNDAARRPEPQPRPKSTGAQAAAEPQGQVMLACAHCGLHLPRDEALPGHGGRRCSIAARPTACWPNHTMRGTEAPQAPHQGGADSVLPGDRRRVDRRSSPRSGPSDAAWDAAAVDLDADPLATAWSELRRFAVCR